MTLEEVRRSSIEDKAEILGMFEEVAAYMLSHPGCQGLEQIRFAAGFAHIAVFFVTILPKENKGEDDYWVVIGDLPPLYLDTDDGEITTPADALEGYTYVMDVWVDAARGGKPEWPIPPVVTRHDHRLIEPNKQFADMLSSRLSFIRDKVVPALRG